jgi:hypothetical protein
MADNLYRLLIAMLTKSTENFGVGTCEQTYRNAVICSLSITFSKNAQKVWLTQSKKNVLVVYTTHFIEELALYIFSVPDNTGLNLYDVSSFNK